MSPVPERPFGVLVDTRLPVMCADVALVTHLQPVARHKTVEHSDIIIDGHKVGEQTVIKFTEEPCCELRHAFRNAEAAEASE
jgi:hypothetical protein